MFWFLLIILEKNNCYCLPNKDETDDELEMIDKNLKNVIEKMKLFSSKIVNIETILNISEAKLIKKDIGRYVNFWDSEVFGYDSNFNPKTANYSIRKLYWQRELLNNVRNKFLNYYSDLLYNYLV